MSEYLSLTPEETDTPDTWRLVTNLRLTDGPAETYLTPEALAAGSPLAQALAVIPGIARLRIEGDTVWVTRQPDYEWYLIIEDMTAAIKAFFL